MPYRRELSYERINQALCLTTPILKNQQDQLEDDDRP